MDVPQIFQGLKVIDFSNSPAGAITTMILADYGATVTKIEPPEGDWLARHRAAPQWYRGKQRLRLNLKDEAERSRVQALAAEADVVVETFRPGVADRLGIGYETLSARNPGLVYCSISAFGSKGPLAHYKAYEHTVLMRAGFGGQVDRIADREGPGFFAVPIGTCAAFHAALQGILAALLVRRRTGQGQHVETSLLHGLAAYDIMSYITWQLGFDTSLVGMNVPRGEYMVAMTKDGVWLQFANNRPRLFRSYAEKAGLLHLYDDPEFEGLPRLKSIDAQLKLWRIMLEKTYEKTWAEWQEILDSDMNLSMEPFRTTQQGMDHRQVRHNGHVIRVAVEGLGETEQIGPLVKFAELHPVQAARQPAGAGVEAAPLTGVTVLEFAGYYAAPYGPALLADLGADVIKVEPLDGEPLRWLYNEGGAVKITQGKRTIAMDLKTPEGQEILRKLIARADILMHNYRPGAPERLNLDYESVARINPNIVYLYAGSYGPDGPDSLRPAFHPTAGAIMGNALLQAGRGYPPAEPPTTAEEIARVSQRLYRANDGNPDPNSALGVGTAMMMGLYARETTGQAARMVTTMLCSNAYTMSDDFIRYPGKPPRPEVDPDLYGFHALYRLYPAETGWVFLACPREEEWPALCAALEHPEWQTDPRFATAEARQAHDAELAEALAAVFRTRPMAYWETYLQARDISCVQADFPGHYFVIEQDEALQAHDVRVDTEHPQFGKIWRHTPLLRFSKSATKAGPGTRSGEHTQEILAELGYSAAEIQALRDKGVVKWPD